MLHDHIQETQSGVSDNNDTNDKYGDDRYIDVSGDDREIDNTLIIISGYRLALKETGI